MRLSLQLLVSSLIKHFFRKTKWKIVFCLAFGQNVDAPPVLLIAQRQLLFLQQKVCGLNSGKALITSRSVQSHFKNKHTLAYIAAPLN